MFPGSWVKRTHRLSANENISATLKTDRWCSVWVQPPHPPPTLSSVLLMLISPSPPPGLCYFPRTQPYIILGLSAVWLELACITISAVAAFTWGLLLVVDKCLLFSVFPTLSRTDLRMDPVNLSSGSGNFVCSFFLCDTLPKYVLHHLLWCD